MFEADIKALLWFLMGAGCALIAVSTVAGILAYGWWGRIEKRINDRFRVENWRATPERLAMTDRRK